MEGDGDTILKVVEVLAGSIGRIVGVRVVGSQGNVLSVETMDTVAGKDTWVVVIVH
jgi:hypothetical protein